ncbi:hypothetical protein GTO91_15910 [Heliobacterium undosum]|uniref:Uncharacterized protein n=1 Tax=Heliomicrobium undosum TaxID=121734 RepID=A0A845L4H0_9FIRM|nr:hypothetical protein [Heliomicrobium undosum]
MESMIALTILSIIVLAATNAYIFSTFRGKEEQNRTTALAFAAEQLERYKEEFSRDHLFDSGGHLYRKGADGEWALYTIPVIPDSAPRNNMVFHSKLVVTSRGIDDKSPSVGKDGVEQDLHDNQLLQLSVTVSWPAAAPAVEQQSVQLTTFVKTR